MLFGLATRTTSVTAQLSLSLSGILGKSAQTFDLAVARDNLDVTALILQKYQIEEVTML